MSIHASTIVENLYRPQNNRIILEEFEKNIFENTFFVNLEYLISNSLQVNFKTVYEQNPHKFCLDYYSSPEMYPIILLVNNIRSIFDFKASKLQNIILAPDILDVYSLIR
jgi:hypothetical protein